MRQGAKMNEIIASYKKQIMEQYGHVDLSYYSTGDYAEADRLKQTPIIDIFVEVDFREYKNRRTTYYPGMLSEQGDKMILSGPGSGKTTFLKKMMCVKMAEDLMPVYWDWEDLYHKINGDNNTGAILCDYFNKSLGNGFESDEIKSFIKKNQFVFFIDRFDKVILRKGIPALNKIIKIFKGDIRDNSKSNSFVIFSRIADYSDEYYEGLQNTGFHLYQINPLTDISIYSYVEKYVHCVFTSDSQLKIREIIMELVRYIEKWPRVKMLACNPLFLNQIISMRKKEQSLPSTELDLYRKCVEMMLQDWKSTNQNTMELEQLGLDDDQIIYTLLNETAYEYFNKFVNNNIDQFGTLSRKALHDILTRIYGKLIPNSQNYNAVKKGVDYLFDCFKHDLGVLVEKSKGQFGFSHFFLLEYLAAQYLKKVYSHRKDFEDYIIKMLDNPRFKSVEGTIIFQIQLFDSATPKFIDELAKKLLDLYKKQKNENILFLLAKLLKNSEALSWEYTAEILSQLVIFKSDHPDNKEIPDMIGEIYKFSKAFKHDFDLLINKLKVEKESFKIFSDKATCWTGEKAKGIKDFIRSEFPSPPTAISETIEKLKKQLDLLEKIRERYQKLKCRNDIIFERFKVNKIMAGIVDDLKRLPFLNNTEISYLTSVEENIEVYTDKYLISQVLEELTNNTVQHWKPGKEKIKITIFTQCFGPKFIIDYQDNGKGIPREDKNKIFDFFYSGDNEKCVGIGLGCVKRNIECIGGQIEEIGKKNEGVHFTIKLLSKNIE
jgi:two-component sensor histidine kinase